MNENLPLNEEQPIKPCHHLEKWVSALADDSLTGPARLYMRMHIAYCHQCQGALAALKQVRTHLLALKQARLPEQPETLTSERRMSLEDSLNALEKQKAGVEKSS